MIEIFRQSQVIGFDTPFDVINSTRVLLKSNQCIVDLVVVDFFPGCKPAVCRFMACEQG
jgi:hypothetical protein